MAKHVGYMADELQGEQISDNPMQPHAGDFGRFTPASGPPFARAVSPNHHPISAATPRGPGLTFRAHRQAR